LAISSIASAQNQRFRPVEGPDFKSKLEAAMRAGRAASSPTHFWIAYSFDVRPGVAVDAEFVNASGNLTIYNGTTVSVSPMIETRNLGVFLLHESASGSLVRLDIYNLERQREYSGYPVYWLGRAGNEESLNHLGGFVQSNQPNDIAHRATMAIALHDDPRVATILKDMIRRSSLERVRTTAIFWLGQLTGEHAFLAELARNEAEGLQIRKQAVQAIGASKDATAFTLLQNLYQSASDREMKKQIIYAVSINEVKKDDVLNFLIKIAGSDPDREVKKQALFWLGQKAGQRSLDALSDTVTTDPDTEVQKHAVYSISRRPKDEAIPMLIKIAKTHPKAAVRKEAVQWLGRSGDERAIEYFKELLSK
jgi:HEAT repeat protein